MSGVLNEFEVKALKRLAVAVALPHLVSSVPGLSRLACPPLRAFVHTVWYAESEPIPAHAAQGWVFERVLPTGLMHLVFRWSDRPLFVRYDVENKNLIRLSDSLVGGARASSYFRQFGGPSHSVGALLCPGTSRTLFGMPADELANRHIPLEVLWTTAEVAELREQMEEAEPAEPRIRILEAALVRRMSQVRGLHPAVADAVTRLTRAQTVSQVVEASGYSHRRLISLFSDAVGLTPKVFSRVARLQRALVQLNADLRPSLAEAALRAGYADQAHLTREFGRIARVSPAYYRRVCPISSNHVPLNPATELFGKSALRRIT